jgi:hypothetical protein
MENLDLDLDNYTLDDLLALFKLDYNFNKEDLTKAYKMTLKTHPDKSGLDQDIFLFLMKGYKMVERVYHFKEGKKRNKGNTEYIVDEDGINKDVLVDKLNGMKVKDFNKWFNKMFEKYKLSDESEEGYDDWYRDTEEKEIKRVNKNDFNEIFNKRKTETRALVKSEDIKTVVRNNGYDLTRDRPQYYSSGLFSKLKYEDLKRAHTETVVPVTEEDYINKQKFNSVDSYRRHRESEFKGATEPESLKQAEEYLKKKKSANDEYDSKRAFKIFKREEEIEKKNSEWWSELHLLKN